jgi:hypothetical protein
MFFANRQRFCRIIFTYWNKNYCWISCLMKTLDGGDGVQSIPQHTSKQAKRSLLDRLIAPPAPIYYPKNPSASLCQSHRVSLHDTHLEASPDDVVHSTVRPHDLAIQFGTGPRLNPAVLICCWQRCCRRIVTHRASFGLILHVIAWLGRGCVDRATHC